MIHCFDVAMVIFEDVDFPEEKINTIRDVCDIFDGIITENKNIEFQAELENNNAVLKILI